MCRRLPNVSICERVPVARMVTAPGSTTVDTLKALMVVAVAIPLIVFGVLAWYSRGETFRHAEEQVMRNDALLREHATAIFEINDQILHRVEETLRMLQGAGRLIDEAALHEYLKAVRSGSAQAFSIWVLRADGSILASS